MVVREDGTKWACSSCLKGHRVSGCTHTDRELKLVPKKGRPVTQCQHCRLERKKRSAHVKCDCGEADKSHHPKEKCIHLREAEEKAKAKAGNLVNDGHQSDQDKGKSPSHLAAVAEEQGCCCHHGGKCTCAILKTDDDHDGSPPHGKPAVSKPRLETTRSDGSITVFANGHHKPVHRKNHAAHESGMPYKMPMPRARTEDNVSCTARRSVDSLCTDMRGLPAPVQSFHGPRRLSKSEQASPKLMAQLFTGANGLVDNNYSAVDFSGLDQVQSNDTITSAASGVGPFPSFDPMSSLADASFDPWSAFPSTGSIGLPNNNPFDVWPTTTDMNGVAQPALTAASSGTQSEIDEIPIMDDLYEPGMPSIQEDVPNFDFDAALASNSPQANINRRSLPPSFFGSVDFANQTMSNDWQMNGNPYSDFTEKNKAASTAQTFTFDEAWQMPTFPPVTDMPHRPMGGSLLSTSSRPPAQSFESGASPNDDIIRQLFPEVDFEATSVSPFTPDHSNSNSQTPDHSGSKFDGRLSSNIGGVTGMDFGGFDEIDADQIVQQPWVDGSVSVSNDVYTPNFNFDQDFSNPDFTGNWIQ